MDNGTSSIANYSFDAYGNKISGGATSTPMSYRDQYFDSDTGLYYLNARYYDPTTGSFTQEDTYWGDIKSPDSLNLYGYCDDNPVLDSDPSGNFSLFSALSSAAKAVTSTVSNAATAVKNTAVSAAKAVVSAASSAAAAAAAAAKAAAAKVAAAKAAADKAAAAFTAAAKAAAVKATAAKAAAQKAAEEAKVEAAKAAATKAAAAKAAAAKNAAAKAATAKAAAVAAAKAEAAKAKAVAKDQQSQAATKAALMKDPAFSTILAGGGGAYNSLTLGLAKYSNNSAQLEKTISQAAAEHPVAYGVGEVVGTLPYMALGAGEADTAVGATEAGSAANPLENIQYTDKVLNQATLADYHGFPECVDAFGADGKVTFIRGGDRLIRTKVEFPGGYMGKEGVFQYIYDSKNICNHRLFVPNK